MSDWVKTVDQDDLEFLRRWIEPDVPPASIEQDRFDRLLEAGLLRREHGAIRPTWVAQRMFASERHRPVQPDTQLPSEGG